MRESNYFLYCNQGILLLELDEEMIQFSYFVRVLLTRICCGDDSSLNVLFRLEI